MQTITFSLNAQTGLAFYLLRNHPCLSVSLITCQDVPRPDVWLYTLHKKIFVTRRPLTDTHYFSLMTGRIVFAGIGEVLSYFASRVHAVKTIPQQFLGMWVLDRIELKYINELKLKLLDLIFVLFLILFLIFVFVLLYCIVFDFILFSIL